MSLVCLHLVIDSVLCPLFGLHPYHQTAHLEFVVQIEGRVAAFRILLEAYLIQVVLDRPTWVRMQDYSS
jgi:hypothetical protein